MEEPQLPAAVDGFYEALNRHGATELLQEALAPEWIVHPPFPGSGADAERYQAAIKGIFEGLPDFRIQIEQVLVQGKLVAVRGSATGTHTGPLFGVPATGRSISYATQDMHRLENGRIVESWHIEDWLTVLFQIGALPLATAPATAV